MRTEAKIVLRNRHLSTVKIGKGTHFTHNNKTYVVNPDTMIVLKHRPWYKCGFPTYKLASYYVEDNPAPMEYPLMENVEHIGISSADLEKIFRPTFYEIIAKAGKTVKQDWMFYLTIVNSLALLYLVYMLNKTYKAVGAIIEAAQNAGVA